MAAAGSAAVPAGPLTRLSPWLLIVAAVAAASGFASLVPTVAAGETYRLAYPWAPGIGVNLSFYVDGLSLLFALMISGIGALVALHASAYLAGHRYYGRFFVYLFAFMVAMLGLVLADNLITLFVFWELTSVTSFLLIGLDHDDPRARRNALQALLVTGLGGLAMLAGFLLLGEAGGSLELSELIERGEQVRADPLYLAILILVLAGAFTKSAQFPFHFWLPNAMAAPTPVSAYLHSATMVKAGIYLLARLQPTLGSTEVWIWTLTLFGAVTAVMAAVIALRQTDLKLVLAYTTVLALGLLTMFLGSDDRIGIAAAITFLIVHSLYKCALFLVIGNVDHGSGSRDANVLGGLFRAMPVTAVAGMAAALSMAGFPPLLGFIGKELKYEGALAVASEPVLVAAAAVIANAIMVALAAIVALLPFIGRQKPTPQAPHEAPLAMLAGPVLLAALGLVFGLVPPIVGDFLVQPAVTAVLGAPETVKLALWHGINLPLVLSIATFALGLLVLRYHRRLRRGVAAFFDALGVSGDGGYDRVMDGVAAVAKLQTRLIQPGILRHYLFAVFAVVVVAAGGTLAYFGGLAWPEPAVEVPIQAWGIVMLALLGTGLTIVARTRLAAICGLGTVGACVAMIFLLYGAPDVAMTQLLVEILFVVIIAVVLPKLPRLRDTGVARRGPRPVDALLALGVGAVMSALTLAVLTVPASQHLPEYYASHAVPEAYGRNIVNVILVDFRALDTLGEIVVVGVAAFAAYALIRLRPQRQQNSAPGGVPRPRKTP
ncbi:MAG: putative monovalent cation/H+ antiporter subunit A [Rhodospirillales bacterium]|nr:putative monovalent cation/H+ antiporter subunit A [Rhodospirillales bacterium]